MRLQGVAQINHYINLFTECSQTAAAAAAAALNEGGAASNGAVATGALTVKQAETLQEELINWILSNRIIEHIFGPNLHVEVIKQSAIILNFVVSKLNSVHIDAIWTAAQLKHCSKQVHDLLTGLVKNMEMSSVLHLYSLLKNLEAKDHNEQTLFLTSNILKLIWSRTLNIRTDHHTAHHSLALISPLKSFGSFTSSMADVINAGGPGGSAAGLLKTSPAIFTMLPAQSGNSNGEDGEESTSASAEPSEDDEEDEDGDGGSVDPDAFDVDVVMSGKQTVPVINRRSNRHQQQAPSPESSSWSSSDPGDNSPNGTRVGGSSLPVVIPVSQMGLKPSVVVRKQNNTDDSEEEDESHANHQKPTKRPVAGGPNDSEEEANQEPKCKSPKIGSSPEGKAITSVIISSPPSDEPMDVANDADVEDEDEEEDSDRENSHASQNSQSSQKRMSDFEGEDDSMSAEIITGVPPESFENSRSRDNMPGALDQSEPMATSSPLKFTFPMAGSFASVGSPCGSKSSVDTPKGSMKSTTHEMSIENVCRSGQTLLWDLLQDDMISQLPDGLPTECEKILCGLIGWVNDRNIRMKFIEGCLENLEKNRSIVISLKLLPKLLITFPQFRGTMETHTITRWAEEKRNMMTHFFSNLVTYCQDWDHQQGTFSPDSNRSHHHLTRNSSPNSMSVVHNVSTSGKNMITHQKSFSSCNMQSAAASQVEQIQIRLNFLSFIFSSAGSNESFKLNKDQVDTLWSCLVSKDREIRDELFSWMINQIRNREYHALGPDLYRYILMEKMPQVSSEDFTMLTLELLHCLCCVFVSSQFGDQVVSIAIKQLWEIALTACNTDVSMTAIKHLNTFYIHAQMSHHQMISSNDNQTREEEFIQECMSFLKNSSSKLSQDEEKHSTIIQRTLLLLKTHLDVFRQRYSYHLRKMQLEGETSVISHRTRVDTISRTSSGPSAGASSLHHQTIRVVIDPAAINEKTSIEMSQNDYIGELRAEATHYWESLVKKYSQLDEGVSLIKAEGPPRLLSGGQELSFDSDDKTLSEIGFKDMQIVYISIGSNRNRRNLSSRDPLDYNSFYNQPPPALNCIPSVLLLNNNYFEQLFDTTQQLGSSTSGSPAHIRCQVLSRRVWEIIGMLPTSPDLLKRFQEIGNYSKTKDIEMEEDDCYSSLHDPQQSINNPKNRLYQDLLSPNSPQKLMYSIEIVEWLRRTSSSTCVPKKAGNSNWSQEFIASGGLRHIFDIFVSGILQQNDSESTWNEWKQDCLASLLQSIYQFGIARQSEKEGLKEIQSVSLAAEGSQQKTKKRRKGSLEKLYVQSFNQNLLNMLNDVNSVLKVLLTILNEATSRPVSASLSSDHQHSYQTGFYGRNQIVHHTLVFLTSWAYSDPSVGSALFSCNNFPILLKKLVLDDPDPAVRREACTGLYKMCLGYSSSQKKGHIFIPDLLNSLLTFATMAQSMRSPLKDVSESPEDQMMIPSYMIEKEPYGAGSKDYFWLVCRLIDSLDIQESSSPVNFENLCRFVAESVTTREVRESRKSPTEDEGLKGLLSLMTVSFKHNPSFKFAKDGKEFLVQVFKCLFDLPSQIEKNLPKAKVMATRSTAFDLLVEFCKGSEDNHSILVSLLMEHHYSCHNSYPWDFWPHEYMRSEAGYVGLINLGATCYMASCLQHLFMLPDVRYSVLGAKNSNQASTSQALSHDSPKHEAILLELQKIFTFLMESERKSYNPKNFCKVYTMDHELLNTGEQKDMTEFFTDLISKFEEMSDGLKDMVKNLFGGTLSNNVVSLDCNHISRTMEEFYTLRCKVADMRNIFDSLDELTVKDTLEGDNMYTCSQCGKKVRAEKRACIKKLPRILCFNTMRYTFNMITMTKEKVNTHFSFPLILGHGAVS